MKPADAIRLYTLSEEARQRRQRQSIRAALTFVLITTVVLEFAVGVAVFLWTDKSWDEMKDLLSYGVAPLAAALAVAATYWFTPER